MGTGARGAAALAGPRGPGDSEIWQARAQLDLHEAKADAAYEDLLHLAHEADSKGWRSILQTLLREADKTRAGAVLERLATPELLGAKAETWVAASQLAQRFDRKHWRSRWPIRRWCDSAAPTPMRGPHN